MGALIVGFLKSVNKISATDYGVKTNYDYGESDIDTGFVIYELTDSEKEVDMTGSTVIIDDTNKMTAQTTRNQYVWVPVYDVNDIYGIDSNGKYYSKLYKYGSSGRTNRSNVYNKAIGYNEPGLTYFGNEQLLSNKGLESYTDDKLYQEINRNYIEMIKSVTQYGGFYIGRYETGNLSRINDTEFKNVKRNTDLRKEWYYYYKYMYFASDGCYTRSSMIWGNLWDRTMQWLYDTGNRTYEELGYNSEAFGNYYKTILRYMNSSNEPKTKTTNAMMIPSGSSEQTKTNNIYDMAGNEYDYTMESYDKKSVARGGGWAANSVYWTISRRDSLNSGENCFRNCLIIKN